MKFSPDDYRAVALYLSAIYSMSEHTPKTINNTDEHIEKILPLARDYVKKHNLMPS